MNKVNGKSEDDLIAAGFHKLDPHLIENRPPKIHWGEIYKTWPKNKKVEHLEKLASSMNHAAYLIQDERNQLGDLCELKEDQIQSLKTAIDQNNAMIQKVITDMNAERQQYNKAIADLNTKIRVLENGDND